MKLSARIPKFCILHCALCILLLLSTLDPRLLTSASAQRDYLTAEEVELVRVEQQIDRRIEVLVKAADRRFEALGIDVGGAKFSSKDAEKWGVLPESTRPQLFLDIRRILQKAIDDIDSLYERPDSAYIDDPKEKRPKGHSPLIFKAVRNLAKAAERYRPALETQLEAAKGKSEQGSIEESLYSCEQIIESVLKLPAEAVKQKKKN